MRKKNFIMKKMKTLDMDQHISLYEIYKNLLLTAAIIDKTQDELSEMMNNMVYLFEPLIDQYVNVHYDDHALKHIKSFASEDVVKYCSDKITELKGNQKFYIGATCNPDARLREHFMNKYMTQMHVLCIVKNLKVAEFLESTLIRTFCKDENILNVCLTRNGNYNWTGGEGLVDGKNYIYLLMR